MELEKKRTVIAEETLRALEWERVIEIAGSLAASTLGSERLFELEPPLSRQRAELLISRTQEMVRVLTETQGGLQIEGLVDIRDTLTRASVQGASLEPLELRQIAETLKCASRIKQQLEKRKSDLPELGGLAERLWDFARIAKDIEKSIGPDGLVTDDASPELKKIRQERSRENRALESKLESVMQKWADQGVLQDSVINYRDGKLVLPVKDEAKHRVQGVMVDTSASGATVFLEPVETLPISNRLRQLDLDERREIHKILLKLTAQVHEQIEEIAITVELLAEYDELYARGRLALRWEGIAPALNESGAMRLWTARHPLLIERIREARTGKVVPLSLELVPPVRTVVISGPNAGGKTVALKTVGLLSLMASAGFFIPAASGSELPHFASIHADIGDAQSLESDLSTFTGHVARLKRMTEEEARPKLLLVDEIGSSTDPAIGAALAEATLLEWTMQNAVSIVTTHHGALKAFAHETEAMVNGSMAFDEEKLTPTFVFRAGLPGSSYALEIAQRVGFPENVLSRARALLDKGALGLEELVGDLSRKIEEYEKLRRESDLKLTQYEGLSKLYSEKTEELKKSKAQVRKQALDEAEKLVVESRREIEQLVREIKEQQADKTAVQRAHEKLNKLRDKVESEQAKTSRELKTQEPERVKLDKIEIGARAQVEGIDGEGVITNTQRGGKRVEIEIGGMRLWVDSHKLFAPPKKSPARPQQVKVQIKFTDDVVKSQLDLRGMTGEEAIPEIDHYLATANESSFKQVNLIHGKGTGMLRIRVREFLETHPLVKSYHDGGANNDDWGSTIVELH
jgi:DNA mismatch repair protein MutS2